MKAQVKKMPGGVRRGWGVYSAGVLLEGGFFYRINAQDAADRLNRPIVTVGDVRDEKRRADARIEARDAKREQVKQAQAAQDEAYTLSQSKHTDAAYAASHAAADRMLGGGRCPDCGEQGERKGHQACQYPQD